MRKFINNLYNYCKDNDAELHISIDLNTHEPVLDNIYAKAVYHDFDGITVPTRKSEMEALAYFVSSILETMKRENDFKMPVDSKALRFYNALGYCLVYVDYQYARYNYDFECNHNLNLFYSICNAYHIQYNRHYYAFTSINEMQAFYFEYGFYAEYTCCLVNDYAFEDDYAFAFDDQILLEKNYGLVYENQQVEDWLSNPVVKELWNRLPFPYIREHYLDLNFYDTLKDKNELYLFCLCVDAVNKECAKIQFAKDQQILLNLSQIERCTSGSKYIHSKLNDAYNLKFITDYSLSIDEVLDKFISKRKGLSKLLQVFPSYEDWVRSAISRARKYQV